eukprot:1148225-Pelagomonas_calceolata.AAC.2
MRIGWVVSSAPRRLDSPSPGIHLRAPNNHPSRGPHFQSDGGVGVWTGFQLNKVDIPVLRRDFERIKVGLSAWDRAHKEGIRAALVAGRGASTIRKNSVWNSS